MTGIRRGLTLLETLLASAILAMLAGACIPMISAASRSIAANGEAIGGESQQLRFDLAALADAFMIEPSKFGYKDLSKDIQQGDLSIQWPADSDGADHPRPKGREGIVARGMPPKSEDSDHLWLVFTCENQSVMRYLALPKEAPPK